MATALDHIRVAAFTHFAAGPIAAQYLGALGADVVKVESPQRDVNRHALRPPDGLLQGINPYFLVTNRNQRCLGLDLKQPGGLEAAKRRVAQADIVLENYRPGVMDRLGLGFEDACRFNPDIIYCSLSGYDQQGPARDRPGQDLLLQALSGLASLTGRGDGPPIPVGAYIIDGFTAMQGVAGILAALRHRDRSGEGQWVRADMMSSALYLMAQESSYVLNAEPVPVRSNAGIAHVHQSAPYGVYQTRDGAIVISTFGGVPVVRRLAGVLGILSNVELHLNEKALRTHREDVARQFARAIAGLTTDAAIRLLEPTGAWICPVRSLAEALTDPAVVASGLIREIDTAYGGRYRIVTEPLKLSATPIAVERPAPAPGEHTREVLAELGWSEEDILDLIDAGAAFAGSDPSPSGQASRAAP
jgi:crotonobetainyl-CoA:carnitine CoA-transferase CaiB-like acyl-CoA transferase